MLISYYAGHSMRIFHSMLVVQSFLFLPCVFFLFFFVPFSFFVCCAAVKNMGRREREEKRIEEYICECRFSGGQQRMNLKERHSQNAPYSERGLSRGY